MIAPALFAGWLVTRDRREVDRLHTAESLTRALVAANAEKDALLNVWVRGELARRQGLQMAQAIRELYTMPVDGARLH